MKYGKRIIAVAASVMLLSGVAMAGTNIVDSMNFTGEAKNMSIEEALKVAVESSPDIDQYELNLEKSKEDYAKNRRGIRDAKKALNSKKGTTKYTKLVEIPEMQNEFMKGNAERNLEATTNKVKSEVESAYFSLQQAKQLESINKTNLEIAQDTYNKTKQKLDLGLVAKQEVIKSELSLTEAQNKYDSSINNAKLAQMNLNIKLGNDVMDSISVPGELTYNKKELGSIKEAIESGLANRNELLAQNFNAKVSQMNMDLTSKEYPESTYPHKAQKIETERAMKSLSNTNKMIEMEIRKNYMNVEQKEKEIIQGQKQVELAEEGLKLTQLSYDVGMAVLTELQQAQNGLLQAKLGLSKAILEYNLAVMEYENSIGLGTTAIQ